MRKPFTSLIIARFIKGAATLPARDARRVLTFALQASDEKVRQSPDRQALARMHTLAQQPVLNKFRNAIKKALDEAKKTTLKNLRDSEDLSHPEQPIKSADGTGAAFDFLFDPDQFGDDLFARLHEAQTDALDTAGTQLNAELGIDDPFTMPPAKAKSFIAARDNLLSGVPDEIHEQIQNNLSAGFDAGDSIAQLAKRVQAAFEDVAAGRAEVIAQTETHAAFGFARITAMDAQGVEKKQWLVSHSPLIKQHRDDHLAIDGEVLPIDEAFEIGADRLMYPGDDSAPAAQVINCHCHLLPVVDEDFAGKLAEKRRHAREDAAE